jgi:hypothetical protein
VAGSSRVKNKLKTICLSGGEIEKKIVEVHAVVRSTVLRIRLRS